MNQIRAGAVYFALTFLVGFVLGPLRELVLKPQIGGIGALLVEAPIMLAAMGVIARRTVRKFRVSPRLADRAVVGLCALGLLLVAEALLSNVMRAMSIANWLAHFASAEGMVSAALYLVFAAAPIALLAFEQPEREEAGR